MRETDDKVQINEHRIYQQFISNKNLKAFHYNIVTGLSRFVEDDLKLRFRYFLGLNIPLNKKEMNKY